MFLPIFINSLQITEITRGKSVKDASTPYCRQSNQSQWQTQSTVLLCYSGIKDRPEQSRRPNPPLSNFLFPYVLLRPTRGSPCLRLLLVITADIRSPACGIADGLAGARNSPEFYPAIILPSRLQALYRIPRLKTGSSALFLPPAIVLVLVVVVVVPREDAIGDAWYRRRQFGK